VTTADLIAMADELVHDGRLTISDGQLRALAADYLTTLDDLDCARSARNRQYDTIVQLTEELNALKLGVAFRRVEPTIAKLEREFGHDDEKSVDLDTAPVPHWLQTLRAAGAL
jgi:hypothetical protein